MSDICCILTTMPNRSGRSSPKHSERSHSGPRRLPNKLFVGNLTKGTSKLELEREFSRFGKLADIWVSHVPPGFAFIEYFSSKDASECVQSLDGRAVLSQKLRVEFAKSDPHDRPVRRKKVPPELSTSRRSRSPIDSGLSSRPRLLPPPKLGLPVIGSLSSRRSPSPLLLLRRGGSSYEDVRGVSSSWSSSILPPIVRARSRSPRARSPALPHPSTSRRDTLSSSGRLLAPPPPSTAALFALAGGYATGPAEILSGYGKSYPTSSHVRSPLHARSRSPIQVHSRTAVRGSSRGRARIPSRSPSPVRRGKLLGRTPPPPSPSPPRQYGHIGRHEITGHTSPQRRLNNQTPSPYSRVHGAASYGSVSPPPRPEVYLPVTSSVPRWSRSQSASPSPPVRKRSKKEMTPPAAYRLSRSRHSSSSSVSSSRSRTPRRSRSPPSSKQIVLTKSSSQSHRHESGRTASPRYSRNEVSSNHVGKSPSPHHWSPPTTRRLEHSSTSRRRSPSPDVRPRNGGSHTQVRVSPAPAHRTSSRRH